MSAIKSSPLRCKLDHRNCVNICMEKIVCITSLSQNPQFVCTNLTLFTDTCEREIYAVISLLNFRPGGPGGPGSFTGHAPTPPGQMVGPRGPGPAPAGQIGVPRGPGQANAGQMDVPRGPGPQMFPGQMPNQVFLMDTFNLISSTLTTERIDNPVTW